ncbi:O-antigen ligase family protein [Xanthobacter sp. KR7-65]|uniref:O-antigen ligase family protein n=1 Tax=Xanthobacter sp. KR7-65 TaxID=3156612 RepID=UPI0032B35DCF
MSANPGEKAVEVEGDSRSFNIRNVVDRFAYGLFLFAAVLAPLPFGSKSPFWLMVWTTFAAIALLLADGRRLNAGSARVFLCVFVVFLSYLIVALAQLATPATLALEIWGQMWLALGIEGASYSVAVKDAPFIFLLRPLLCLTVFAAALIFSSDDEKARWLLRSVAAVTVLGGIVGLVALMFDIRALRPFDQGGSLVAFFVSKNTSAIYLGSGFLILFAILALKIRSVLRDGGEVRSVKSVLSSSESRILMVCAAILLVLLPLTLSRAGLILTIALASLASLTLFAGQVKKKPWVLPVLALGTLATLFVLTGNQLHERLVKRGLEDQNRVAVYEIMVESIGEHPLLGMGLGTFRNVFPSLRTEELGMKGIWDLGHSTPLELAFEGGLPLVFVVLAFFILCGALLVRGIKRRPDDPYILAALLVGLLGALHSCIDFSLQLPGYAAEYMALTGLGVGRAMLPAERARRYIRSSRRRQSTLPRVPNS